MKLTLILIVQVISLFSICAADVVPCEDVAITNYGDVEKDVKFCRMFGSQIHSQKTYVSTPADPLVRGFTCRTNKKILFLPLRIDLKFPNLKYYSAGECAIQKVSKNNFKNLIHLTELLLLANKLETVPRDAFEDLIAIEKIDLKNNNIKVLNGETFGGLPQLKYVDLENNECINELFNAQTISDIVSTVDESCQFCESSKTTDEQVCELSRQIKEISGTTLAKMLEAQFTSKAQKSSQEISNKMSEVLRNVVKAKAETADAISKLTAKLDENLKQEARIATLEAQVIAAEEAKTLLQFQLQELKQIYKNRN